MLEIKSHLKRPNIFNSHEIGNYESSGFRYVITIPNVEGEVILEQRANNIRILKNTLTNSDVGSFGHER